MCGIVGFTGRENALPILIRDYTASSTVGDSAGIAAFTWDGLRVNDTGRITSPGRENPALRAACPAPAASAIPAGRRMGSRPTAIPIPICRRSGTAVRSKVAVRP